MQKNIYLVGFMGTGKSTIGKELARLTGRKFIDMDLMLEKRLGMTIGEVFEAKGELFFRAEEKKLAFELAETHNRVIATGGGTILDEDIKATFASHGIMICLITDRGNLISRLNRTDKRPLLKGEALEERVARLMEERKDIYDKIPLKVDTTNLSPKEAAEKIVNLFKIRQKILDQLQNQYIIIS
ncbi:MAG: shikimate kinase [Candidatus Eremiobacteraeota bacterium]|nr:shikimate kinase [Candidatus Eremiobacteraeota bacterium]